MKNRITSVLSLMCLCTLGLLCFGSYWNYQAYVNAVKSFKSDINIALEVAVEEEANHRQKLLREKYRAWISDTSMITIRCEVDPTYKVTRFYMVDRYPPYKNKVHEPSHLSFKDFPQLLDHITPEARAFFIENFIEGVLKKELKDGWIHYYTHRLGDSLSHAQAASRVDIGHLRSLYGRSLRARDVDTDFRLLTVGTPGVDTTAFPYASKPFRTYGKFPVANVKAWFPDPDVVFVRRMKWVLLSSLLLAALSLFCFYYTIATLLRQKKLSELKNDFVNNMTHELKTPVATIGVAAEAIQHYGLDRVDSEEYAGIIREQAANLSRLIDQILKSAIEEEQMELHLEKICLPALVQSAVGQMKPLIEKRGARVEERFTEPVWVIGSQIHLTNVVVNLLDNALKYSAEAPLIMVSGAVEDKWAVLRISDNGIGIPESYQGKVFDRFFRVPTGNVHTVKGYGLGLSYAKTVVEKHKGSVSLESRKKEGTRLTIKLPVHAPGSVPHPAARR
jgi:signal transduction histidine kinase